MPRAHQYPLFGSAKMYHLFMPVSRAEVSAVEQFQGAGPEASGGMSSQAQYTGSHDLTGVRWDLQAEARVYPGAGAD